MTYEYECTECKHAFEADQKITDDALTTCPKCNKESLIKVISGGGFVLFRGSGDYKGEYYGTARRSDGKFE